MKALFIGVLCHFHGGLESPFRYYYFLSLICSAIRHPSQVTYATCALHSLSLRPALSQLATQGARALPLVLTLVTLELGDLGEQCPGRLLKRVGNYLGELNAALREHQTLLEDHIAERTRELQEAQAHVLHQEKMAAFGLLAAGIAHEVGNPLTAISSLVQMLQRRGGDAYTAEKLALVSGQLQRIQTTLRELVTFWPAGQQHACPHCPARRRRGARTSPNIKRPMASGRCGRDPFRPTCRPCTASATSWCRWCSTWC